MHNGERERVVSQNGTVLRDAHVLRHKSYTCYDGFRQGVWLRMTTDDVVEQTPGTPSHWWSVQQTPVKLSTTSDRQERTTPTRDYIDGVYHNARQHRIYAWNDSTSIHLYTTDGKHYRVVIEYQRAAGENADEDTTQHATEFRWLVCGVAFHFSQYVRRQRGVGQ